MKRTCFLKLLLFLLALPQLQANWVETPYGHRWNGEGNTPERSALKGTFYDLRRLPNGHVRTDIPVRGELYANRDFSQEKLDICQKLIKKNPKSLKKYYRSPVHLYATSFFIPMREYRDAGIFLTPLRSSNSASSQDSDIITEDNIAEQNEHQLKASHGGWLSVYTGKVKAPASGQFRFAGVADDCMIVLFNNKMALECGYDLPSFFTGNNVEFCLGMGREKSYQELLKTGTAPKHKGYSLLQLKSTQKLNSLFGGFITGPIFTVKEGETYPITVIHIDLGGSSGMYLMIQQIQNGDKMSPLALFRTEGTLPATLKERAATSLEEKPKFSSDSPIWEVVADSSNP